MLFVSSEHIYCNVCRAAADALRRSVAVIASGLESARSTPIGLDSGLGLGLGFIGFRVLGL